MHTPEGPAWASRVVWGFLWGPMCLSFCFLVPAHVWCLSLFSLVLLAGFCFLLLLFLFLAFCSLSLLLSAFGLVLFAFCVLFLLSVFCLLLLRVLDRKQHGCNKTIAITTATITMALTKDSHYSNLYSILLLRVLLSRVIFPVTNDRTSRNNKRFPCYTTIIISITHRYF